MKSIRLFFAAVLATVMSVGFVACSDDDSSKPGVDITPGEVSKTTLSFTITPKNADQCAWVCIKADEPVPAADEILANPSNAVPATEPIEINVSNLTTETEYYVIAVVSDGKSIASKTITMKTSDKEHITMDGALVILSGGWGATIEADLRFVKGEDVLGIAAEYDSNAKYLPAGEYSSDKTGIGSINTADETSTYFYINGELLSVSKATMNIELDGTEYNITVEFSTEQGDFVATYKGEVEGVEFYFPLELTSGRRAEVEGEIPGEYCIKLNNAPVRTVELTLDLFADPSSTTLPAGTYTVGTSTNPGTIGSASSLKVTTPSEKTEQFASGTVVVTQSGDDYTFDIKLADADGYEYIGVFTGEIEYMVRDTEDPSDRKVLNFNRYKTYSSSGDNNSWFMLINDDSIILDINAFTDGSSTYLPAGTYNLGTSENAWTILSGKRSTLTQKFPGDTRSTAEELTEATMTVSVEGDQYTIIVDLTVASGKYRCKYTGEFETERDSDDW